MKKTEKEHLTRYPDITDVDIYTKSDVDEAWSIAENIINLVTQKIS